MKNITIKEAHDAIIQSFGKYGWRPLNDYLRLRNVILFGEEKHDYVPDIDKLVPSNIVDGALDMLDNELVISISRTQSPIKPAGTRKGWRIGYVLNILSLGKGYVCGWDLGVMNRPFYTLEECLNAIKERKDGIANKVSESKAFYITGDADAVEKVAEVFGSLSHIDLPNCDQ